MSYDIYTHTPADWRESILYQPGTAVVKSGTQHYRVRTHDGKGKRSSNAEDSLDGVKMSRPKTTNPTKPLASRWAVLFSVEDNKCFGSERKAPPPDPNINPLFGIPLNHPDWPGRTEYQEQYGCTEEDQSYGGSNQQCYPWPTGPRIQLHHPHNEPQEYRQSNRDKTQQARGEVCPTDDPTEKPVRPKEAPECRETVFGLVRIPAQEQKANTFIPNYRYKEWPKQGPSDIFKQNEMTSTLCRMPAVDSRFLDFYHNVRMNRPNPPRARQIFVSCGAVPLSKDDSNLWA